MASVRKREWTHNGETKTAWVVTYTDQAGKRRLKTFDKKKDADKYRTQVEVEIERGEHVPDSASVTVSKAIDLWLERCEDRVRAKDRLRPRTLRNFRSWVENHIRPHLGHMLLKELNIRTLQAWVDGMAYDPKAPRGRPTIENTLVCLRLILKDAQFRGLIGRNVLKDFDLRIPGRPSNPVQVPSKDEVRELLAASGQSTMGGPAPYLRPLLFVAVFAGLRLGEIRALTWGNVDFEKDVIRVRVAADNFGHVDEPKTRAGIRDVPLAPALKLELMKWKLSSGRGGQSDGLVFQSNRGNMIDPGSIQGSWARLQHRVFNGGKGQTKRPGARFHFHALRHVTASLLIESGLPPKRIQCLMGHSSIQMTFDRYGHLFDNPQLINEAMGRIGRDILA